MVRFNLDLLYGLLYLCCCQSFHHSQQPDYKVKDESLFGPTALLDFTSFGKKQKNKKLPCRTGTYKGKVSSTKQRFRRRPTQSWTPTMPKMKKTKKQSSSTLPSMGRVSSSRVTRMRIPAGGRKGEGKVSTTRLQWAVSTYAIWRPPWPK